MAKWFMFVRVENPTAVQNFNDWQGLVAAMTPTDFEFAFLEERPGVINNWSEDRWGFPIGPYARVWSVASVVGNRNWIGRIMDAWAENCRG